MALDMLEGLVILRCRLRWNDAAGPWPTDVGWFAWETWGVITPRRLRRVDIEYVSLTGSDGDRS